MFDDTTEVKTRLRGLAAGDAEHSPGYEVVSVRPEHLLLLRHANVSDVGSYTGTSGLDAKRPFGNSDIQADMLELLLPEEWAAARAASDDGEAEECLRVSCERDLDRLLDELRGVLQVSLGVLRFEEGVYRRPKYHHAGGVTRGWGYLPGRCDVPDPRRLRQVPQASMLWSSIALPAPAAGCAPASEP